MRDPVPYDELDVGIRRLVRVLNDHNFDTSDSGDGKSKFTPEGEPLPGWESDGCLEWILDVPHVAMTCDPEKLVDECDRLAAVLSTYGITAGADDGQGGPSIQGIYIPTVGGVILLTGVDDSMLVDS